MEKSRIIRMLALAIATCLVSGQAMAVPSIWNTGVDGSGNALAPGVVDTHYALITPGGAAPAIATNPNPLWVVAADPTKSSWIAPSLSSTTDPVGVYTYTLTFNIDLDEIPTELSLGGQWASDNPSEIFFNGVSTGFTRSEPDTFITLADFEITTGFQLGANTLVFEVENTATVGPNPTGLLVTGLELEGYPNPIIPAPGALLLVSLGTGVIGFIRRRVL